MSMIGLFYSHFSSVAIDQRASVILSFLALCGMFLFSLLCYALILVLCRAACSSFLCSFFHSFRSFFLPLHRDAELIYRQNWPLHSLSLCLCLCSLSLTLSFNTHTFSLPPTPHSLSITFSLLCRIDRVNCVLHKRRRLREIWSHTHTHTHKRAHTVYRGRIEDRRQPGPRGLKLPQLWPQLWMISPTRNPRTHASILDLQRLE